MTVHPVPGVERRLSAAGGGDLSEGSRSAQRLRRNREVVSERVPMAIGEIGTVLGGECRS